MPAPQNERTTWNYGRTSLMRHGVDHIVDSVTVSESRHFLRIIRHVGEFPGVADVGVKVHRDYGVAIAVLHGFPGGLRARRLHRSDRAIGAAAQMARAGNPREILLFDV